MEGWKSGTIENIWISLLFCLVVSEKSEGLEKMNLYKFAYILMLKNDTQLKQKHDKQPPPQKKNHPIMSLLNKTKK